MTKISLKINFLDKLKSNLFPFYKSKNIKKIFKILNKYKRSDKDNVAMFVGGCVRKYLTNKVVDDIDIATSLSPSQIIKIFKLSDIKVVETGIKHGTLTLVSDSKKFEITTLRKDLDTDGRHANVEFVSSWELDAKRRDFTINAIYVNTAGEIYDPLNGIKDLKNGKVCFIGDPNLRIKEDYLRIIRYIRFFTQYSKYDHEKEVIKAIKVNIGNSVKLSKERLLLELYKILELKNFEKIFQNKFTCFIILSLFPQLKNYNRLINVKTVSNEVLSKINKDLILATLLIDETDDSEYFIYKYNLSNVSKKKIMFIKKNYKNYSLKSILDKTFLLKLCYLNSKELVISLLIFQIFNTPRKTKKIESMVKYINDVEIPKFPIKAYYLKNQFNFTDGKVLGDALKKLENIWIDNNFKLEKIEIESILKI